MNQDLARLTSQILLGMEDKSNRSNPTHRDKNNKTQQPIETQVFPDRGIMCRYYA